MLAIYVEKEWLQTIGEMADVLAVREQSDGKYVSLLAEYANNEPPFIVAALLRRDEYRMGDTEVYLRSTIPAAVVSGMFFLTQVETKKLGFPAVPSRV